MCHNSSAGTATRYGLVGSEFESRWGQEIFSSPYPAILALGLTHPPVQWVLGISSGLKGSRLGVNHPPPSSGEVRNEWSCTSIPLLCLRGILGGGGFVDKRDELRAMI